MGEENYLDTHSWFCVTPTVCPAFVGSTPLKRDAVHTSRQYAVRLAPVFAEALAEKLAR
jgi:hypothetical protein